MNDIILEIECDRLTSDVHPLDYYDTYPRYVDVWNEAGKLFANRTMEALFYLYDSKKRVVFNVSIDPSSIIEYLDAKQISFLRCLNSYEKHKCFDYHIEKKYLTIRFETDDEKLGLQAVENFLATFFMAMNLAAPGSCNFAWVKSQCNYSISIPQLSSDEMVNAWKCFEQWGWPDLGDCSFIGTWNWLKKIKYAETHVSKNVTQGAIITIHNICLNSNGLFSLLNNILWISHALESLLITEHEGIQRLLKKRIESILGKPKSDTKWISKFYNLRSRIIHGDYKVIRDSCNEYIDPEVDNYIDYFWKVNDQSLAVLIALIRKLIINDGTSYVFSEQYEIV